ncbi:hypothetical protein NP233_g2213 [Leucocoprinus birnbaumii]|uniref:Nephrocystin 3-like N-terminal domain-containing protein n=1 Tax=Leucocoprinus birnbaumii TaxID=56174 RepID=A0AAD5YZ77_9AGAR|nr:hypothetical protein NP233_g2213 [Leucocoprinus birnbaumii]
MIVSDSFIDSPGTFGAWTRLIPQNPVSGASASHRDERRERDDNQSPPPGFFGHAHNFVINNLSAFTIENVTGPGANAFLNGYTVFQYLIPHTNPDAAVDSSARWPPPSCHPGTRITICNRLLHWLSDAARQWSFIWLYGSAGCGKSAVAQTFAEHALEFGRLGASFFFSRPNKRNDPKTVIPTLAYQLAVHCPAYKLVINSRLADDPLLLSKAIPVQFKKLIVEPFTHLQRHHPDSVREPFLILLDGLDECNGEMTQCEFIRLINEHVRVRKGFPLLWVIVSRQEAHLCHTFTRIVDSERIELVIDEECRNDVDRYLRDGFFDLQLQYNLDSSWPPKEDFDAVSRGGDGHFVFAATALGFIGDKEYANPQERLDQLIAFLEPHFIYARDAAYYIDRADFLYGSAQALCNFVNIDQAAFYGALRHLYSVIDVPTSEKATSNPLRFYHASFQDFLIDGRRSERFAVEQDQACADITRSLLYWNEVDARHFHADETAMNVNGMAWTHTHACLPGLKWTSGIDALQLSKDICLLSEWGWTTQLSMKTQDPGLLSHLFQLDLRIFRLAFSKEPSSKFDTKLLGYLFIMTGHDAVGPASFPLRWTDDPDSRYREYLFIGCGEKSLIVLCTNCDKQNFRLDRLCYDQPPSSEKVSEYQEWLQKNGWYDAGIEESQEDSDDGSGTSEYYSEIEDGQVSAGT